MAGNIDHLLTNAQDKAKRSSMSAITIFLKLVSGLILGLTFSLIGEVIFEYGTFLFFFVIVLFTGIFWKVAKSWTFWRIIVFDVICILVGTILKMYIDIAPGA